jgi:hypothetical protein
MPKTKKQPERRPTVVKSIAKPIARLIRRPDRLTAAQYERPSKVRLSFADGLSGVWSFQHLELEMSGMKVTTIKSSASGEFMEITSKWNEAVEIDAASLRAMIDPSYAAELEKAYLVIRGPIDELVVTAKKAIGTGR